MVRLFGRVVCFTLIVASHYITVSRPGLYVPYAGSNLIGAVVLSTDVIKIIVGTGLFLAAAFLSFHWLVVTMTS